MNKRTTKTFILFLILSCLLSGCFGSLPTKYYLLSATNSPRALESMSNQKLFLVRPVQLPEYLNKDRIVRRKNSYEIVASDFHLWAEPLEKNILRVLIQNLRKNENGLTVEQYSSSNKKNAVVDIQISIERFERVDDKRVELQSEVILFASDKHQEQEYLYEFANTCEKTSNKEDQYRLTVHCMSEILSKLSDEIIKDIL